MSDLALIWNDSDFGADIALEGPQLVQDNGLLTAIIISLFTDYRAGRDDPLPDPGADRRGFWGDTLSRNAGFELGSKLWLLSRSKQLPSVLVTARDYADQALAWLREDQVAARITTTAQFAKRGWLALSIVIERPNGPARQRFDFAWNATENQLRSTNHAI